MKNIVNNVTATADYYLDSIGERRQMLWSRDFFKARSAVDPRTVVGRGSENLERQISNATNFIEANIAMRALAYEDDPRVQRLITFKNSIRQRERRGRSSRLIIKDITV